MITRLDIWHVLVTKEPGEPTEEYFFKSAGDVEISGQKTWHHIRNVYKDVRENKIEFIYQNHDFRHVLLVATRLSGEVKTEWQRF